MGNTAFVFPGQGSHYVGMGKVLHNEFITARRTFEEANDILGYDIKKICFQGSLLELNRMECMAPSILVASTAACRVYLEETGEYPVLSAGHSLGEYSALACSGAISFRDALRILHIRSMLIKNITESGNGTMTVVNGVSKIDVENECNRVSTGEQVVVVACYNSPEQFVISGHKAAVTKAEDALINLGAQITPILMSPPFHSPLMESASNSLRYELCKFDYNKFNWPVISNTSATLYANSNEIVEFLALQIMKPVQWQATIEYMEEKGVTTIVEMGPKAVLTNLILANTKNIKLISYGQKNDRETLHKTFISQNAGNTKVKDQNKRSYSALIPRCLAIAVCTKNRNWNEEEYQKGVVEPYERIEKIQEELESKGLEPTVEQMKEALDMLKSVFTTKKYDKDKQVLRFKQIFEETGAYELFHDFPISI